MKLRALLLGTILAATLAPIAGQATNCDSPIYIFARYAYPGGPYDNPAHPLPDPLPTPDQVPAQFRFVPSAVSSAVGCTVVRDTVVGGEDPLVPHEAYDTDVIYPGANVLQVRLLDYTDPSIVESATLAFAGETYPLTMTNTLDITGAPATFLDSQDVVIDPADTVAGNEAVATICLAGEECFTRTYRTLG
jgi:hypothetical protein